MPDTTYVMVSQTNRFCSYVAFFRQTFNAQIHKNVIMKRSL